MKIRERIRVVFRKFLCYTVFKGCFLITSGTTESPRSTEELESWFDNGKVDLNKYLDIVYGQVPFFRLAWIDKTEKGRKLSLLGRITQINPASPTPGENTIRFKDELDLFYLPILTFAPFKDDKKRALAVLFMTSYFIIKAYIPLNLAALRYQGPIRIRIYADA